MLTGFYTPAEEKAILEGAAEYDRRSEVKPEPPRDNEHDKILAILYPDPKAEAMGRVKEVQEEIAVLASVRDKFFDNDFIREHCNMLMRVYLWEIEELRGKL